MYMYMYIDMVQDLMVSKGKWVFVVSDPVRHKPGCTAKEDSLKLEISDIVSRSRGFVLSV